MARMEFAPTDFAQEVASLYRGNYQRGVSVGFKPVSYEERRHDKTGAFLGIRFLEQELLEVSAVPVPANRSALRKAIDQAPLVSEYFRSLESSFRGASSNVSAQGVWPELVARIDDLGKLVSELSDMIDSVGVGEENNLRSSELGEMLVVLRSAKW